jgi:hypothetical protein
MEANGGRELREWLCVWCVLWLLGAAAGGWCAALVGYQHTRCSMRPSLLPVQSLLLTHRCDAPLLRPHQPNAVGDHRHHRHHGHRHHGYRHHGYHHKKYYHRRCYYKCYKKHVRVRRVMPGAVRAVWARSAQGVLAAPTLRA